MEKNIQDARARGHLVRGGLPHGHTFLRLQDIRGYENLMFDMAEDHPNLKRLIGMVEDFNYRFVQKYMTLKPDIFYYPEDLGMQVGPHDFSHTFRNLHQTCLSAAYEACHRTAVASLTCIQTVISESWPPSLLTPESRSSISKTESMDSNGYGKHFPDGLVSSWILIDKL